MSPSFTPVYRLPFVKPGEPVLEIMERTRYMTIDRQLEALFTFLGDGVMSGWEIIQHPDKVNNIIVKPGSGVANKVAVATNIEYDFALTSLGGDTVYGIFVAIDSDTPQTAAGTMVVSTTVFDVDSYLLLGTATVNSQSRVIAIDTSENSGRVELTFLNYLITSIANHVHTGAPGEPDKIDLQNHVKGVLSAANIEDLPASKITSGIFDKERFRLSHNDLGDIGTLTHTQIDSLIGKFQNVNKMLFGDLVTSNLIQLILSLKHVWGDVDDYFYNFFALIPGIDNNKFLNSQSFIDANASDAEIDYLNHRIRGKYVPSKEIGQYVVRSVIDFSYDGVGALTYDPIYVKIEGREEGEYGYGYGYGFGEGLDYFDVLYGPYDANGVLQVGVSGTEVGFGVPWFEQAFANTYGWGYGYEEFSGFTTTLTSTRVTLVPSSSSRDLHDKNIDVGGMNLEDNHSLLSRKIRTESPVSKPTKYQFLVIASDSSDSEPSIRASEDFHSFSAYRDVTINQNTYLDADKACSCLLWDYADRLDMSIDDYLYIVFSQVRYRRSYNGPLETYPGFSLYSQSFDPYWSPDVTVDLIIESTVKSGDDYYRVFHTYAIGKNDAINHFLSITDNSFFESKRYFPQDYDASDDPPALARIQANIIANNLVYIGGYKVRSSPSSYMDISDADTSIAEAAGFFTDSDATRSDAIKNITGFYIYTENSDSYGFDFKSENARALYFPMGMRNLETEVGSVHWNAGYKESYNPAVMDRAYDTTPPSTIYKESTMLVDIDEIYVGGIPGFRYDPVNNIVNDITITFPDPVTFNSMSWISTEPSDSLVYIQVKRLDSLEGVDSIYNDNAIFTNKGTVLNSAQFSNPTGSAWLSSPINPTDPDFDEQMARKYRVSGSDFPSEYNAVRSVSFRVVLLPSTDFNVAPVLNSISINFTSNTKEGDLVVSTNSQWSNFRAQSSITDGTETDGTEYVTIDIPTGAAPTVGKIKNLLYGTDKAVIEVGNSSETWLNSLRVFNGSTLPKTVVQETSKGTSGLAGYVTGLQKRSNGNIIFLDQEASRIVEIDKNYEIVRIIASEYAYKNTLQTWMPGNLIDSELVAKGVKAVYNPNIGDSGVLYLVFSHELWAWKDMYGSPIDYHVSDPDTGFLPNGYSIDLSKIQIVVQATDINFSDCIAFPVDRGTLCIMLTESKNNYIASNLASEIKLFFKTETIDVEVSSGVFEQQNIAVWHGDAETLTGNMSVAFNGQCRVSSGVNRVPIEKPDYDVIYAPIQGIVAFDIDDDDILYVLKKTRPYLTIAGNEWETYDTLEHEPEPWYVKMSAYEIWDGWLESTMNHSALEKNAIPVENIVNASSDWEPDFYVNKTYGHRGSIQKKDEFLLMNISGEKSAISPYVPNGVYLFSKKSRSGAGNLYAGPEEFEWAFTTTDGYYAGMVPMAARFDPLTYNEDDNTFGSVYIAVSDLRKTSSINSKSKVIKADPASKTITWEWGSKSDLDEGISDSFSLIVNDVFPLSYNDTEIIVST